LSALVHRLSTLVYRPDPRRPAFTWIGDERIAVGGMPTGSTLMNLPEAGFTHVVNCRATPQTIFSQDLAVEQQLFGAENVSHAPMWDHGKPQSPAAWAAAAQFAADVLDRDPQARVLIHCQKGRRRSVLVTYAALRLRGRSSEDAARVILEHRKEARVVPAYRASVEEWLLANPPRVPSSSAS
jgi:protein-tyrosine phosphatase